jgi:hypothetical protein
VLAIFLELLCLDMQVAGRLCAENASKKCRTHRRDVRYVLQICCSRSAVDLWARMMWWL